MGLARIGSASLAAIFATGALFGACGTDAVGIEACRAIEAARCEQAPACFGQPGSPSVETEEDVRLCREFYRDQCLLGVTNPEATPGQPEIDACVAAVEAAGACAAGSVATVGECGIELVDEADPQLSPCQALNHPERFVACSFVVPPPEESEGTSTPTLTTGAQTTTGGGEGGSGGGGGGGGG